MTMCLLALIISVPGRASNLATVSSNERSEGMRRGGGEEGGGVRGNECAMCVCVCFFVNPPVRQSISLMRFLGSLRSTHFRPLGGSSGIACAQISGKVWSCIFVLPYTIVFRLIVFLLLGEFYCSAFQPSRWLLCSCCARSGQNM